MKRSAGGLLTPAGGAFYAADKRKKCAENKYKKCAEKVIKRIVIGYIVSIVMVWG